MYCTYICKRFKIFVVFTLILGRSGTRTVTLQLKGGFNLTDDKESNLPDKVAFYFIHPYYTIHHWDDECRWYDDQVYIDISDTKFKKKWQYRPTTTRMFHLAKSIRNIVMNEYFY